MDVCTGLAAVWCEMGKYDEAIKAARSVVHGLEKAAAAEIEQEGEEGCEDTAPERLQAAKDVVEEITRRKKEAQKKERVREGERERAGQRHQNKGRNH
eukprot:TRINITY_DN8454_c0_g1_i1.p2 TRINITY_DN8454_c0_g1~~TRINITY_DN8454_c0_g1_i1.p2  ORF type:complete len:106 (+),score=49.82 TRINITY_DN8454_c0_g1_i1:25-318(+)